MYLVLAAQYESWVLPFIILLGVPLAVFGALSAQLLRGLSNDVFCQVGLVMLIGLAAKNSILIVEFAEQLREQGQSIVDAAVEAARIRLRPILMTSFAFILGVLPLAFATGAGRPRATRSARRWSAACSRRRSCRSSSFRCCMSMIRTLAPGAPSGSTRPGRRWRPRREVRMRNALPAARRTAAALLAAGLCLATPALAQTPPPKVEFDEAVRRALEQNPTVAEATKNIMRAEALLQQARGVHAAAGLVGRQQHHARQLARLRGGA